MTKLLAQLPSYAESLIDKCDTPAVSIAIWHNNKLHQAAAGILNVNSGIEATVDSIFQIGSVSKVFTTSLVMQLVDEGRINLDKPVTAYLRDFHVADDRATQAITIRQLLNHSSGIPGDYVDPTQGQDHAIARYLDRMNLLSLDHPPGAQFSYSNAGFIVAGRLVEVLLGCSWSQAIEERIFAPLGMKHAIADPKEALRYRAAMGHFPDQAKLESWQLSPNCYSRLGFAHAPAGTAIAMSAKDLITFARAHLNLGQAESGEPWLSSHSIQLMQTPDITLPCINTQWQRQWGLGWAISTDTTTGNSFVFHSGLVAGNVAMLQLFPDRGTVFAVLLNSDKPGVLENVSNYLTRELTGIDCTEPDLKPLNLEAADLVCYTGTFDGFNATYDVTLKKEALDNDVRALCVSCHSKLYKTKSQSIWLPLGNHIFAVFDEQGVRLRNAVYVAGSNSAVFNQVYAGMRVSNRVHNTSNSAFHN